MLSEVLRELAVQTTQDGAPNTVELWKRQQKDPVTQEDVADTEVYCALIRHHGMALKALGFSADSFDEAVAKARESLLEQWEKLQAS